jgi:hypothetical protein
VTLDPSTGKVGPAVLGTPFTQDPPRALASIERIRASPAAILPPGRGEPWHEGVVDAVRLAGQH